MPNDMTSRQDDLDRSVADGIISLEQATAIRERRAGDDNLPPHTVTGSEEPLTLVSNFGDVFLCLGLFILYSSATSIASLVQIPTIAVFSGFAVLFWLLAEYFVFRLRHKFPAIISTILFAILMFQATSLYLGEVGFRDLITGNATIGHIAIIAGAFAFSLARFRLPILVLFLGISGTFLAYTVAKSYWADAPALWVLAGCGITLLAIGIYVDTLDRARTGLKHEWALWLFVVGSPLTIHPLFLNLVKDETPVWSNPNELITLVFALALVLTLAGLLLDRRSLVASSMLYVAFTLSYASYKVGLQRQVIVAIIPFAIGFYILVIGTQWNRIRGILLKIVPFRTFFRPVNSARQG